MYTLHILFTSTTLYMFLSFQGNKVGWLDARNLCRERCMDLVSIETFEENMMVMKLVHERRLKDLWTSGRLCNFKGCDAKHLQPRKINGV